MRWRFLACALGLVLIAVAIGVFATQTDAPGPKTIALPEVERVEAVDGGYLYASNRDLRDILFDIDLHYKNQGLTNDIDSEAFEFPDEGANIGELANNSTSCVVFEYFNGDENTAIVTLIPPNPECFTQRYALGNEILNLYKKNRYVYSVTINSSN